MDKLCKAFSNIGKKVSLSDLIALIGILLVFVGVNWVVYEILLMVWPIGIMFYGIELFLISGAIAEIKNESN